nr:ABC-2 transporter permease [Aneurinibacillus sp. XH2]
MLFSLVKKDLLLVKKYLLFMVVFSIIAPMFITVKISLPGGGLLGFFITVLFTEYILLNTLSSLEDKYKGAVLLSATPYTRKTLIQARYLFSLIIFVGVYVIYTVTSFVSPVPLGQLNLFTAGLSFLFITAYCGVLLPVQYKYGYEKTKFISSLFVILTPFVGPFVIKWLQTNPVNLDVLPALPQPAGHALPVLMAILLGLISMTTSVKIYSQKNL